MSGKYLFKLLIAGSRDSGKTALIQRYTTGLFTGGTKMTIGVDYSVTSCNTQYGQATLQIWNLEEEERFRTMVPSFCLAASGGIIIFDLTKKSNFTEAIEWFNVIRNNTRNIPIILVGNKENLKRNRCVNKQTILRVAEELRVKYMEFDLKTEENVMELFREISTLMIENNLRPIAPTDTASEVAPLQSLKKYLFKLIIAGSSGSGKTKLIQRYTSGRFTTDETKMTQGVDFSVTSCNTQHGPAILQIWDFGGKERFRPMLPSFCHGAAGGILIFDLTKQSSFTEVTEWFSLIRENTKKNIPIILGGNKSNLIQNRCISRQKIQKMTDKLRIKYVEFDLKTGENVVELFRDITTLMIEKNL